MGYRKNNLLRYAYQTLKDNAKRRGKDFSITLTEFNLFCDQTNYLELKGRGRDDYHIDRKHEPDGYTFDNMQLLRNHENVSKYHSDKRLGLI